MLHYLPPFGATVSLAPLLRRQWPQLFVMLIFVNCALQVDADDAETIPLAELAERVAKQPTPKPGKKQGKAKEGAYLKKAKPYTKYGGAHYQKGKQCPQKLVLNEDQFRPGQKEKFYKRVSKSQVFGGTHKYVVRDRTFCLHWDNIRRYAGILHKGGHLNHLQAPYSLHQLLQPGLLELWLQYYETGTSQKGHLGSLSPYPKV